MIKIYHNPECGTSRNAANLNPRQALRTTKSPDAELGLLDETVSN